MQDPCCHAIQKIKYDGYSNKKRGHGQFLIENCNDSYATSKQTKARDKIWNMVSYLHDHLI
jgi:hypothetical protein